MEPRKLSAKTTTDAAPVGFIQRGLPTDGISKAAVLPASVTAAIQTARARDYETADYAAFQRGIVKPPTPSYSEMTTACDSDDITSEFAPSPYRGAMKSAYVYTPYPKWLYHPVNAPHLAQNESEHTYLVCSDKRWVETPYSANPPK